MTGMHIPGTNFDSLYKHPKRFIWKSAIFAKFVLAITLLKPLLLLNYINMFRCFYAKKNSILFYFDTMFKIVMERHKIISLASRKDVALSPIHACRHRRPTAGTNTVAG